MARSGLSWRSGWGNRSPIRSWRRPRPLWWRWVRRKSPRAAAGRKAGSPMAIVRWDLAPPPAHTGHRGTGWGSSPHCQPARRCSASGSGPRQSQLPQQDRQGSLRRLRPWDGGQGGRHSSSGCDQEEEALIARQRLEIAAATSQQRLLDPPFEMAMGAFHTAVLMGHTAVAALGVCRKTRSRVSFPQQ
jgi:hypothetical protein